MSTFCEPHAAVIHMGVTPYYENSLKTLTKDSSSVGRVLGAKSKDYCDVVKNCSVIFIPPANHALMVSPIYVNNGDNIGSLSIYVDHRLMFYWDDAHEFNRSVTIGSRATRVNGLVKISVNVETITTTWKHFELEILLTAFLRMFS